MSGKTAGKLPQHEAFALAEKQLRGVGRPSIYKPEYAQEMIDYFSQPTHRTVIKKMSKGGVTWDEEEQVANEIPTFEELAHKLGITRDTLHRWSTEVGEDGLLLHPEFSDAYKNARELQEKFIVANALNNRYNPAMSIFYLKNKHDYRDKQELDANITGGVEVGVVSFADALKSGPIVEGEIIESKPELLPDNRTSEDEADA